MHWHQVQVKYVKKEQFKKIPNISLELPNI